MAARGSDVDSLSPEVGHALRRARLARGLTLRQVQAVSGGKYRASSLGGYERGKRRISLDRFCELATFYRLAPDRLLAEVLERVDPQGRQPLVIDLNRLTLLVGEGGVETAEFVHRIQDRRGDHVTDVVTLRSGDLEELALAADLQPRPLIEKLLPALRNPVREPE